MIFEVKYQTMRMKRVGDDVIDYHIVRTAHVEANTIVDAMGATIDHCCTAEDIRSIRPSNLEIHKAGKYNLSAQTTSRY